MREASVSVVVADALAFLREIVNSDDYHAAERVNAAELILRHVLPAMDCLETRDINAALRETAKVEVS